MPLQMPTPSSPSTAGSKSTTEQQLLRRRRYTLQTISEFAPQQETTQESVVSSPRGDRERYPRHNNETICSKSSKRQSLPIQWPTSQHSHANAARVPVASTVTPTLRRSFTDSKKPNNSTRSNSRRRSMPSSFEPRGRSLSPVAEGELSRHQLNTDGFQSLQPGGKEPGRQQCNKEKEEIGQYKGGWNARRERELVKREQALLKGNAQRENVQRERERFIIGRSALASPSTHVPDVQASPFRHFLQPLPSNQIPAMGQNRPHHRVRDGRNLNGSIIDGRLFLDLYAPIATCDLRRSLSTASEPRLLRYKDVSNQTTTANMRSSSSNSYVSLASTEHHPADPRPSSPPQTSFSSTRPSSTRSSGSGASGTTKYSQGSSLTYTRGSDHPLRQNPVWGHQEPLVGPVEGQSRHSGGVRVGQGTRLPCTSFLPRQFSRTPTGWRTSPSKDHFMKAAETDDVIYRENPDKRGMARRRPSRHEMNGPRRRAAREGVQERVRRANELEERKEQELVREEKQKEKKGKKTTREARGLFCGLYGG